MTVDLALDLIKPDEAAKIRTRKKSVKDDNPYNKLPAMKLRLWSKGLEK
jgi:hypothetical protein